MTRLGILGGTFDPPHIAHLIMAEFAREQFQLDRVLWVVAADPPHKHASTITQLDHRLAMTGLAIEKHRQFEISRLDIDRPGPHFTVDMLDLAAQNYPKARLHFLIGSDSLHDLSSWHEPHRLTEHATVCVMRRDVTALDTNHIERAAPNLAASLEFIDAPLVTISASGIRERVQQGCSIRYLLPDAVERYIAEHYLYSRP